LAGLDAATRSARCAVRRAGWCRCLRLRQP